MEQNHVESMKWYFKNHLNPVVLFDEEWSILWSNCEEDWLSGISEKLSLLHIGWENQDYEIALNGVRYHCHLICNELEQVRIAEFTKAQSNPSISDLDMERITANMQTVIHALYVIYGGIENNDRDDVRASLNTVQGACHQIYRIEYLRKELEKMITDRAMKETFCVNLTMDKVYANARSILRSQAEVSMETCNPYILIHANEEEFLLAVLSGILLCYRSNPHLHHVSLKLDEETEGMASVQIAVSLLPAEIQPDSKIRGNLDDMTGETALMEAYCRKTGSTWMMFSQPAEDRIIGKLTFPIAEEPDYRTNTDLRSHSENPESTFFSPYAQMLSKINYQTSF